MERHRQASGWSIKQNLVARSRVIKTTPTSCQEHSLDRCSLSSRRDSSLPLLRSPYDTTKKSMASTTSIPYSSHPPLLMTPKPTILAAHVKSTNHKHHSGTGWTWTASAHTRQKHTRRSSWSCLMNTRRSLRSSATKRARCLIRGTMTTPSSIRRRGVSSSRRRSCIRTK